MRRTAGGGGGVREGARGGGRKKIKAKENARGYAGALQPFSASSEPA